MKIFCPEGACDSHCTNSIRGVHEHTNEEERTVMKVEGEEDEEEEEGRR
jgi:uncharacterized protein (UPF0218 family)